MIVSLTIVRYKKLFIPFALLAMAVHRLPLSMQKGCSFWKLMGSGKNGTFDTKPDWQQWAVLAVWDDRISFKQFHQQSFIAFWWNFFLVEKWTILLSPLQSHGKWDNKEPFGNTQAEITDGPVAVLTRATIRLNKLKAFWANVDSAADIMATAKGYISSFGIGEAPLYRQATFSLWESLEDVKAFAYRSREHSEVIRKTRAENWYKEELFARFKPIATFGSIKGKDPMENYFNLFTKNESNSRTTAP